MQFRICVVGCGWVAEAMHGPAYVKYTGENKEAFLAGCCDIDEKKAAAFRKQFGFENAYTCMEEMLKTEKPDVVCLLSPAHLNAELAEVILSKGFPLLMEKPPGRTGDETQKLIDIARKGDIPHRVAFNRRYAPLVRALKERLDDPRKIQSVQYDMLRVGRLDEDFSTTAIHAVDTAKFLAGSDYKTVRFDYREYPELGKNVADIHMHCIMESGAVVKLNICPVTGISREGATVCLHDETFFLDYPGDPSNPSGKLTHFYKNDIKTEIEGSMMLDGTEQFEQQGFYYMNKSFFDALTTGEKPSGELKETLQSVMISDFIRNRRNIVQNDILSFCNFPGF